MDSRATPKSQGLLGIAVLLLAGCATVPDIAEAPVQAPSPIVVVDVKPAAKAPSKPQRRVVVAPAEPVFVPLPPVAIVVSARESAYENIVSELVARLPSFAIYDLSDRSQSADVAFSRIRDERSEAVIAIGLHAAQSAIAHARVPVIFSQVFNYQDFDLVTESSRGVAAIAPIAAQLDAWVQLDPLISTIGIIIGPDHDDLVASAETAARERGIRLIVRQASSDQETLFHFKRMSRDIDGFWLFPDNRILSGRVLRRLLDDAAQQNVAVLVPNDALLDLGAALSITTSPTDVANAIESLVRRVQDDEFATAPSITPLTTFDIAVNEAVMRRRGQTSVARGQQP